MYPENRAAQLPADVKMLITGWQALNTEQKTEILHAILTKI